MKLNMNKYIGDIDSMRSMQSITENHVTCVTNKMWYFAFMTLYIFKGNLSPKKEISSFAWRLEISFFHICKFGSIQLNNQNLFHISHEICFRLGAFSFVPTPFVIG